MTDNTNAADTPMKSLDQLQTELDDVDAADAPAVAEQLAAELAAELEGDNEGQSH